MTKENLKIVFMGTPQFAVESLKTLIEEKYNVVGVVTMPDKPIGRHQTELSVSAVKQFAQNHGLPILQPASLRDEAFLEALRKWEADIQIVVAFRMLPEVVWAMPPFGTFNTPRSCHNIVVQHPSIGPLSTVRHKPALPPSSLTMTSTPGILSDAFLYQSSTPIMPVMCTTASCTLAQNSSGRLSTPSLKVTCTPSRNNRWLKKPNCTLHQKSSGKLVEYNGETG